MGYGYGSEWQLTRFLGRHRAYFTELISTATNSTTIDWLDFNFRANDWLGDGEPLGLSFLENPEVEAAFRRWWPHGSGIMNWDAVGRATNSSESQCWILVEAKAHIPEIGSHCKAGPDSLLRITAALEETKAAVGAPSSADWIRGYYQHANRLAVLHFLTKHCVEAQLVNLYFYGSTLSDTRSPQSPADWEPALTAMKAHLGLSSIEMGLRVQDVFVDLKGSPGI